MLKSKAKPRQDSLKATQSPLSARWFKYCGNDPTEKTSLEQTIRNSRYILDIIRDIVKEDLEAELAVRRSDYDNPSWAYSQADKNGAIRALKSVLALVDDETERTN